MVALTSTVQRDQAKLDFMQKQEKVDLLSKKIAQIQARVKGYRNEVNWFDVQIAYLKSNPPNIYPPFYDSKGNINRAGIIPLAHLRNNRAGVKRQLNKDEKELALAESAFRIEKARLDRFKAKVESVYLVKNSIALARAALLF